MKKCPKCGYVAEDNERFCINCGVPLEEVTENNGGGSTPENNADMEKQVPGLEEQVSILKGKLRKSKTRASVCTVVVIIMGIACAVLGGVAIELSENVDRCRSQIKQSEMENKALQQQVGAMQGQVDYMDKNVALVYDDDDYFYHKYNCSRYSQGSSTDSYEAANKIFESFWSWHVCRVDEARLQDYEPCPDCH